MASNYLRDDERIVRFVPWSKLRRDEDDNVIGVLPQAFELRADEDYLSATWCEYYNGTDSEQLRCAIEAIRNSDLTVGPKARFAVGVVGEIRAIVEAPQAAKKLRIIHEPEDDNPAHAAVRHWPREDLGVLELLASSVWSTNFDAQSANNLPTSGCSVSARGAGTA
ncbi:hypothetical protein [Rhizobium sp. SG570]|uniref:hypothetical protein n=1 Tax=Rhizobium sp. SG570 TaxID=2587113 RepID=UPI0014477000|nr:hypothetical protein [Rhizobium sp. SG570]NKJ34089.1 hypothetical protein [Rhizobium sp. SG570]